MSWTTQCGLLDLEGAGSQLSLPWSRETLTTLLQCLKDPYETNKSAVLQVLHSVPAELHEFHDEQPFAEFLTAAVELTRSARPPDSVTAAYFLTFLSGFKVAGRVVRKLVQSQASEADVQTTLRTTPRTPPQASDTSSEMLLEAPSGSVSETFSRTASGMSLGCQYLRVFEDDESCGNQGDDGLLWMAVLLLSELECQLEVARRNLLEASSSGPLYGVMISLRTLLRKVPWRNLPESDAKTWKALLDCSVSLAFGVAEVVSPVVTNASPEGQLDLQGDPDMLERMQAALQKGLGRKFDVPRGECKNGDVGVTEVDAVKSTAVAAQMLLLCGWRAHREVSLLFGELCENCQFGDASEGCLLSVDQVLKIGAFFMEEMSSIRHRGAFEQAYTAFQKLCHVLWRCKHPELVKLPLTWLKDIVSVVRGGGVSSTRRSAGIPYIVQAVLVSEPQVLGSAAFQQYMAEFLKLADCDTSAVEPKVHAINVLRALFREARLGDVVMPYVADGVKVAIVGFESNAWAVRNAATLLFSTLMTRIFGVNRSRDEPQRRNCLTAHVFFLRFPPLFHFLLDQLNRATTHPHHQVLGSSRFPVLLLLSRLFPSVMEGGFRLDEFVPHVIRCSWSPSWKVRALAARAVVPLVAPGERRDFMLGAISSLPNAARRSENNAVHGTLLQVVQMVNHSRDFFVEQEFVDSICHTLGEKVWLASECNPCLSNRAAYLDVVLACLRSLPQDIVLSRSLAAKLTQVILPEVTLPQSRASATCEEFFVANVHAVLLEIGLQHPSLFWLAETSYFDFLLRSLSSRSQETRFVTLQFMKRATPQRVCDACLLREPKWSRPVLWRRLCAPIVDMVQEGPGSRQQNASSYSEACVVLASFDHPDCLIWERYPTVESVLEFIVDRMAFLKLEHTKQSLLALSCHVAEQVIHARTTSSAGGGLAWNRAVWLWTRELLNCSEPTRDLAMRVTASKGLGLLVGTVASENTRGGVGVTFWKALVNFLQDDEVMVRDNAVSAVHNLLAALGDPEFPPSLFSRRTPLDIALRLFAHLGEVRDVVPCLVDWMLTCQDVCLEAETDEQPFEKGELNTYAEEVTLTELCSELLKASAARISPVTTFSRKDFSCLPLDFRKSASESAVTLEDIYKCCVKQFSSQANEVFRSKTTLLLNRHMDLPLIVFYQHVSVAAALRDCVDRRVVADVSSLADSVLTKLKLWSGLTTFLAKTAEKL